MKILFFLPDGFGFWYQAGILKNMYDKIENIGGTSSGSIICLIYLLKKNDITFELLSSLALKCLHTRKHYLNIYEMVDSFLEEISNIIEEYDENEKKIINLKLSNIKIQYSIVRFYYIFPYVISKSENPQSIQHLKKLIKASTYIPILSYHESYFYYLYNDNMTIDGYFSLDIKGIDLKINSSKYCSIIPCSYRIAKDMFNKGFIGKNIINLENTNYILKLYFFLYNNVVNFMMYLFSFH